MAVDGVISLTSRKFCGATHAIPHKHEDHWPCCTLEPGHSTPHHDAIRGAHWPKTEVEGKSEVIPGGASRVPTTTDYSQLSHIALRLMAETQAEGNAKYGYGNWQKGIPVSNLASHALEHILKLINGDTSENHLGHALWNLEKMAHFIETRPDLIDIVPMQRHNQ